MKQKPRSSLLAGVFFDPTFTGQNDSTLSSETAQANQRMMEAVHDELNPSGVLLQAIDHHLLAGGQRIRMMMALATGRALGLAPATRMSIAIACELIHNASLIHDDIQDHDRTRRKKPAVWAAFGVDVAILAGDYLLSAAYGQLAQAHHEVPALIAHLHQTTQQLIQGQSMDLLSEHQKPNGACHSLEDYRAIAVAKSGTLLALPLELSLIAAKQQLQLPIATSAAQAFAIAYQIADDIADAQEDLDRGNHNILKMLKTCKNQTPLAAAITEARLQCAQSCGFAKQLPNQSGRFLLEQAATMDKYLASMEAVSAS